MSDGISGDELMFVSCAEALSRVSRCEAALFVACDDILPFATSSEAVSFITRCEGLPFVTRGEEVLGLSFLLTSPCVVFGLSVADTFGPSTVHLTLDVRLPVCGRQPIPDCAGRLAEVKPKVIRPLACQPSADSVLPELEVESMVWFDPDLTHPCIERYLWNKRLLWFRAASTVSLYTELCDVAEYAYAQGLCSRFRSSPRDVSEGKRSDDVLSRLAKRDRLSVTSG